MPAASLVPGTYLEMTRLWQTGDVVAVHFPMQIRFEQLDDKRLVERINARRAPRAMSAG